MVLYCFVPKLPPTVIPSSNRSPQLQPGPVGSSPGSGVDLMESSSSWLSVSALQGDLTHGVTSIGSGIRGKSEGQDEAVDAALEVACPDVTICVVGVPCCALLHPVVTKIMSASTAVTWHSKYFIR